MKYHILAAVCLPLALYGCSETEEPTPGLMKGVVIIPNSPKSESAVKFQTGYLVSSMVEAGSVTMYGDDGVVSDSFERITGLVKPRGLSISKDQTKLWVADDNGVSEYLLTAANWTLQVVYDTASAKVSEPNGLCLTPDETKLFATQPGFKLNPYGPSGLNGLVQIDLSTKTVTEVFSNEPGHTPNGCFVADDVVWMVGQQDGITSFNMSSGEKKGTADFALPLSEYQKTNQQVGDGIVMVDNVFYTSTWGLGRLGMIHKLGPDTAMQEIADIDAADMQLDLTEEDNPKLIAPSLSGGEVRELSIKDMPDYQMYANPVSI